MEPSVNSDEKLLFAISVFFSVIMYLILIFSVVGIIYIITGIIISIFLHGLLTGSLRGNSVKVSETQFPEVYALAQEYSRKMKLLKVPDIYVINGDGIFNAFATKFLGRNFIAIYSDVLELAYEQGEAALAFVICHELAHIKCNHLSKRAYLYPSMAIPFLGAAYSRACEYTCDHFAACYRPDGAVPGILALAVGKKLYRRCDPNTLSKQAWEESGFWVWFSEILSTHPYIPKRLNAVTSTVNSISARSNSPAVDSQVL